jgi:hypothetical protein
LTGHGIFNSYRKTINKESHSRCWECNAEYNDAEHALFNCPKWIYESTSLESHVGEVLTINNIIEIVVEKEEFVVIFKNSAKKS